MVLVQLGRGSPLRLVEWLFAVQLLSWGLVLIRPESTFSLSMSFEGLAAIARESTWAWACILAGGLRILTLSTGSSTVPSDFHLRSLLAAFSALFWFTISYSIMGAGTPTTGLAMYPCNFVFELICIYRISADLRLAKAVA